jgi:hypothetical protein
VSLNIGFEREDAHVLLGSVRTKDFVKLEGKLALWVLVGFKEKAAMHATIAASVDENVITAVAE